MNKLSWPTVLAALLSLQTLTLAHALAHAHGDAAASQASALSMLPIAVSVAAPVALFSAGAAFTVLSAATVAEGSLWLLERASDGARFSVTSGMSGSACCRWAPSA